MLTKNVLSAALMAGAVLLGGTFSANAALLPVDDPQWNQETDLFHGGFAPNNDDLTINGFLGDLATFPGSNFGPVPIIVPTGSTAVNGAPSINYANAFIFKTNASTTATTIQATIGQQTGEAGGFGIRDFRITFFDITGFDTSGLHLDNATDPSDDPLATGGGDTFADSQATTTKDINDASASVPFSITELVTLTFTDSVGSQAPFDNTQTLFLNPLSTIIGIIEGQAFDFTPGSGGNPNYNLTLTAVPLPAPFLLLISALVGMGFLGRRRLSA